MVNFKSKTSKTMTYVALVIIAATVAFFVIARSKKSSTTLDVEQQESSVDSSDSDLVEQHTNDALRFDTKTGETITFDSPLTVDETNFWMLSQQTYKVPVYVVCKLKAIDGDSTIIVVRANALEELQKLDGNLKDDYNQAVIWGTGDNGSNLISKVGQSVEVQEDSTANDVKKFSITVEDRKITLHLNDEVFKEVTLKENDLTWATTGTEVRVGIWDWNKGEYQDFGARDSFRVDWWTEHES